MTVIRSGSSGASHEIGSIVVGRKSAISSVMGGEGSQCQAIEGLDSGGTFSPSFSSALAWSSVEPSFGGSGAGADTRAA